MKRHCKLIISVITMALFISIFPFHPVAYADPFTASQIASTAYAMMQSWGVAFSAGSATASGMNNFMTGQVEDYASSQGGSIADVFVGQIAVDVAGKLVVGQQMYNSIVGFVDWLTDKFGISSSDTTLQDGIYEGTVLPKYSASGTLVGIGFECQAVDFVDPAPGRIGGYRYMSIYKNGSMIRQAGITWNQFFFTGRYSFVVEEHPSDPNTHYIVCYLETVGWAGGAYSPVRHQIEIIPTNLPNSLSWNGTNYVEPTVLNPDKEWTGTIDGYSEPDTNLDDLLDGVDEAVADNNLDVEGEIIDVPVPPTPTPAPIDPDTPLSDVPWQGLDNNLKDLYEQGLEEIGTIGEGFDNVIDTLSGFYDSVIEWLENIYSKIGDLIDSVVDALENILEAIQDIAESILNADANWFSDIVDAILTPFQRWITALKSATGIWHYVIEWIQCIATPFGFFWGILSGIGACFVKPIYAVAAFAIVIAIYKRFGK